MNLTTWIIIYLVSENDVHNIYTFLLSSILFHVWILFVCFSGQRDHSACCKRNSLPDVCLPFCAGQGMNLTLDYMSCVIRLPVIEACVQEGRGQLLIKNSNQLLIFVIWRKHIPWVHELVFLLLLEVIFLC